MSQNPTDVSVVESIVEYNGLNDKDDSLNRPQGTSTNGINVYDEQSGDCNRRAGRDFVSLEANPILVIYQFTWDDNSFSVGVNSNADTTYVLPPLPSSFSGPMPNSPNAEPIVFQEPYIPDFSSYIRAMAEAKQFALQSSDLELRGQHWALDFYNPDDIKRYNAAIRKGLNPLYPNPIAAEVRDRKTALFYLRNHKVAMPTISYGDFPLTIPNTDIKDNVYWVDYYVDRTLILQDLSALITVYNALSHSFVKTDPIEDSPSIDNYQLIDDYVPPSPSFSQKVDAEYWATQARELAKRINENILRVWIPHTVFPYGFDASTKISSSRFANNLAAAKSCALSHISGVPFGFSDIYNNDSCTFISRSIIPPELPGIIMSLTDGGALNSSASIEVTKSPLTFDLSAYSSGTVAVYLSIEEFVTFGNLPRPTSVGADKFGQWRQAIISVGSIQTTQDITFSDYIPTSIPQIQGWSLVDARAVITREEPHYKAQLPGGLYNLVLFPPSESFKNTILGSIGSTETDLTYDTIKLNSGGAADRSVYSDGTRTPFSTIYFSSTAPGFKKPKNGSAYKPSIFSRIAIAGTVFSGSPTKVIIRMYINGSLVRTTIVPVSNNAFGQIIPYSFSILDVGDFTTFRPPDNNPNDEFNGWASPSMRITAQTDTGSIYLNNVALSDVVLNYPL